jgi:hypothetical protein
MSAILVCDRMTAVIVAGAATLTPDTVIGTSPGHLAAGTIVFNGANPLPSEFWEPSATKKQFYRVTIERFS